METGVSSAPPAGAGAAITSSVAITYDDDSRKEEGLCVHVGSSRSGRYQAQRRSQKQ